MTETSEYTKIEYLIKGFLHTPILRIYNRIFKTENEILNTQKVDFFKICSITITSRSESRIYI